jgi:hypothetical protein
MAVSYDFPQPLNTNGEGIIFKKKLVTLQIG